MGASPDDLTQQGQAGRVASREGARAAALDGASFQRLFTSACDLLHRHVEAVNAINVFPVPDGDTGTNMYLTLRAGVEELERTQAGGVAEAAQALARGALMGARGNSGVILSQVLRGFAGALTAPEADGPALAGALRAGADAAYRALSEPIEGTILTAARAAAEAVAGARATAGEVLERAARAAREAAERTPELLPVLKQAGVIDSGALGLAIVLEGLRRSFTGETLDVDLAPEPTAGAAWRDDAVSLHHAEHGAGGYCTEFMVEGAGIDAAAVRTHLSALGTSLLVVGEGDLLRAHLHTTSPDDALAYGRTLGTLSQIKVDNLEQQMERFAAGDEPTSTSVTGSIDVVAVAAGAGMEEAFRSVGVTRLIEGGQTMNPSAGEIRAAIDACPAEQVVVLPNNKNIIAAAEQAAQGATKRVAVLPTRSIPQGVAAVLALNPDVSFEANVEAMARSLASVRSAEVTRAVRATVMDGRRVEPGQAIGLVDGALTVVADDLQEAVHSCVQQMFSPETSLLTLYAGRDARQEDAEALAAALRARHPTLQVEVVRGEQPHYPYILSLE